MTNHYPLKTNLRVLQLIDSLEAGGAERMAVNLANALVEKVDFSGIVTTRNEGILKTQINEKVEYLYCTKKSSLDLNAISSTLRFIKTHDVNVLHAHGSSYFFGFLLKAISPKLKLIWHDHHGNRPKKETSMNTKVLKVISFFFSHIFCVSEHLVNWSKKTLNSSSVTLIHNFTAGKDSNFHNQTEFDFPFILCVANLRWQKNHLNLIEAYFLLEDKSMKLLLVGKDENDEYAQQLKAKIKNLNLEHNVYMLGQRSDVDSIIANSSICVLSSDVEALPMVLIEYANHRKPVVVTDVGQCASVVGEFGQVVKPNNPKALSEAISFYIKNKDLAHKHAQALQAKIKKEFDSEVIISEIIGIYKAVLK
ncbi:glycosyltransferase family 4 protein [Psychroflexus sp. CAK57W]|uniref:glycosyltransferase family 4 protein n=1 Tax=Psychroflexus curvus TaxID=2873595 RepID=UPI001CCA4AF6|nr:glycosyltransferase family 4 protein [Psychroflexus curvus]MBZ9787821.1 glycosyltransferase family 4 protein [Psychroflexus curvus]